MTEFDEMVSAEADDLAKELIRQGRPTVDPVWLAMLIRGNRLARESGHFAACRLPNGTVAPVSFWRRVGAHNEPAAGTRLSGSIPRAPCRLRQMARINTARDALLEAAHG